MIQSMTGYGKSTVQLPNKKITIELKSLNSKNIELNTRFPSMYREKELDVRKQISEQLMRGKIDISFYVETTGGTTASTVNAPIVLNYIEQLKTIENLPAGELLKIAIRFPDALSTAKEELDEGEWQAIRQTLNEAIKQLINFRKDEGRVLEADFTKRIKALHLLLKDVIEIDPKRIEAVRERLQKGIEELKETIDKNRFEQELVYYIEKYDITEEKVRLENHLNYFSSALKSADSNGKKLGFISQEIGREINTIGSKSNYAPMQQLVVQMKDELEKIKEQLLNIL